MESKAKQRGFEFYKLWKNATDEQKQKVIDKVKIISVEGKTYSPMNTFLLANQYPIGGVFGGFKQWREQGRTVKKGEHGFSIMFPTKFKDKDGEEGNTRFYFGTVFEERQTEVIKKEATNEVI